MTAGCIESQGLGVERLVDAPPLDRYRPLAIVFLRKAIPQSIFSTWVVDEFLAARHRFLEDLIDIEALRAQSGRQFIQQIKGGKPNEREICRVGDLGWREREYSENPCTQTETLLDSGLRAPPFTRSALDTKTYTCP